MADKFTNNSNDSKIKLSEIKKSRDEDLPKKYFYICKNSSLSGSNKRNILQLLESGKVGENFFQDVDNIIMKAKKKRNQLEKAKESCIQNLILSNKQIPERWIVLPDYKNYLNKVMSNEKVLNYTIENKDLYEKRSGNYLTDDERYEKYINELKKDSTKKFISYINLNKKYIAETPLKQKKRKDYCLSLNNKKRNKIKCNISEDMEKPLNQMIKLSPVKDLIEQLENNKNNNDEKLPNILQHKVMRRNEFIPIIHNTFSKNEEIKEEFMLTSLNYRCYSNNNEDGDSKKDKKNIELPKLV